MRTTIRVDDPLLERLKARARQEKVSLTRLINRVLKAGLESGYGRRDKRRAYRQRVHAMGLPARLPIDKALALAAALEDEEIVRELTLRK